MQMVFVRPEMLLLDQILKFHCWRLWARFVPAPGPEISRAEDTRAEWGHGPSLLTASGLDSGSVGARRSPGSECPASVPDLGTPRSLTRWGHVAIISRHVCHLRVRASRVTAWRAGDRGNHAVYHRQGELHQQQLRGGRPPLQRGEADYWEGEPCNEY